MENIEKAVDTVPVSVFVLRSGIRAATRKPDLRSTKVCGHALALSTANSIAPPSDCIESGYWRL